MSLDIFLSIFIFVITVFFIIWQPKGLNIGIITSISAFITIALGLVSIDDVLKIIFIIWDATLAFVGIIFISIILEKIGFFEWISLKIIKKSNGNGKKLFVYIILLGAFISAIFSNDGTALILTPILYSNIKHLNLDKKSLIPFIIAGGFVADTTSLPFIISNLVNILTTDFFNISFFKYSLIMFLPSLFAIISTLITLYLFYRKDIVNNFDLKNLKKSQDVIKNYRVFKFSIFLGFFLGFGFLIGEFLKIPPSFIILTGAFLLGFISYKSEVIDIKHVLLKETPWNIIFFSLGMYIVVYSLKNVGLTLELANFIEFLHNKGELTEIFGVGALSSILSAIMNNLPSVMIINLAIFDTNLPQNIQHLLAYANIIGCNIGTKLTPIGSLSTLIWFHILEKKGIKISWKYYFKVGLILTPPILLITLLALYISILIVSYF